MDQPFGSEISPNDFAELRKEKIEKLSNKVHKFFKATNKVS